MIYKWIRRDKLNTYMYGHMLWLLEMVRISLLTFSSKVYRKSETKQNLLFPFHRLTWDWCGRTAKKLNGMMWVEREINKQTIYNPIVSSHGSQAEHKAERDAAAVVVPS